jgi:hypothetical protein
VCHTSQGQDERAPTRLPRLLRGLDLAWRRVGNPHRESGTRWRAAADVGQAAGPRRPSASSRKGTIREPFGDSVGARRGGDMPQVAPFFVSKKSVAPFFVVTWLPNLSSSDAFKGISGPDSDEKLVPNIIDKYTGPQMCIPLHRHTAVGALLALSENWHCVHSLHQPRSL